MYGDDPGAVIPLAANLKMFHRRRVQRVLGEAPDAPDAQGIDYLRAAQQSRMIGGNAASFLTSF